MNSFIFFSFPSIAEIFNCNLEFGDKFDYFDNDRFEITVDIGDKSKVLERYLGIKDLREGIDDEIILKEHIKSTGTIIFNKPHPYGFETLKMNVYFTWLGKKNSDWEKSTSIYQGLVISNKHDGSMKFIEIDVRQENYPIRFVDADKLWGEFKGSCDY